MARDLVSRCRTLTRSIGELERELRRHFGLLFRGARAVHNA